MTKRCKYRGTYTKYRGAYAKYRGAYTKYRGAYADMLTITKSIRIY